MCSKILFKKSSGEGPADHGGPSPITINHGYCSRKNSIGTPADGATVNGGVALLLVVHGPDKFVDSNRMAALAGVQFRVNTPLVEVKVSGTSSPVGTVPAGPVVKLCAIWLALNTPLSTRTDAIYP